jgi:hypothetical protein
MRKTRLHKGRLTANDSSVNVIFTINFCPFDIFIQSARRRVILVHVHVLVLVLASRLESVKAITTTRPP